MGNRGEKEVRKLLVRTDLQSRKLFCPCCTVAADTAVHIQLLSCLAEDYNDAYLSNYPSKDFKYIINSSINQRHGTHFEMMCELHPRRLREMLTST